MIKDYRKNMSAEVTDAFKGLCLAVQTRPSLVVSEHMDSSYAVKVTPAEQDRGLFVSLAHPMRTLAICLGRERAFTSVAYVLDVPIESPGRRPRIEVPDRKDWGAAALMAQFGHACQSLFGRDHSFEVKDASHKTTVVLRLPASGARHVTDLELEMALSRVFGAAARARGRKLYVELRREL